MVREQKVIKEDNAVRGASRMRGHLSRDMVLREAVVPTSRKDSPVADSKPTAAEIKVLQEASLIKLALMQEEGDRGWDAEVPRGQII